MTEEDGGDEPYGGVPRRWKLFIAPVGNLAFVIAGTAFGFMFGVLLRDDPVSGWMKRMGLVTSVWLACLLAGGTLRLLERIAWPALWEKRRQDLYQVLSAPRPLKFRPVPAVVVFGSVTIMSLTGAWILGRGWPVAAGWFGGAAITGLVIWEASRETPPRKKKPPKG